jgi:phosphate-selective porin OprO/OprP
MMTGLGVVRGWKGAVLTLLLCAAVAVPTVAQATDAERIVVTNVQLNGRHTPLEDVRVNLLIVGGQLVVVSKDDLVIQPSDVAVDARSGFLLGKLALRARPTFLILDRDPREDFNVLLNTAPHVRFAIRDGMIVKNELPETPPSPSDATPKPRLWGAYQPPPLAVPLQYFDSRKWNKLDTIFISGLFTGGLILDQQYWLSQNGDSEAQVGDLSGLEGGEIRAFRFGVVGSLNFKRPWGYTVFVATHTFDKGFDVDEDDDFTFVDYRLDIPLPAGLNLSVGKQKEPISMERLTALSFFTWQERSAAADALLPARNFGATLSGTAGDWSTLAVGAFNNWIDSDESFSNTSSQIVGRATWVPAVSDDESNLLHLGVGIRYSNAKQSPRGATEPEFNNAPLFVDTGPLLADDLMTYSLEAYWRNGPYLVGFEYLGADVDSADSGDPFFYGYHVSASWAVTGEMRSYRKRSGVFDPLRVASPVNHGGWGTLETGIRYSRLDLNDGTVDGGELDVLSLGINWWLTQAAQVSVNYRYIWLDRFGINGDNSGLNMRLLLVLD